MNWLRKHILAQLSVFFFVVLSIAWLFIFRSGTTDAPVNHIFGFIYGGFSLWGGIIGIFVAREWGGFKSLVGKSILLLSLGLLGQAFGQYSFWYYNFALKIEVPYPGIPALGYFGTIPCYIAAAWLLAKSSGAKISLQSFTSKLQAILIPVVMLSIAFLLFLRNYQFDTTALLQTFLDFGYPIGQSIYISIAILTFSLTRKILGGSMRTPVLLLIAAFFAQFLSDYIFIYFHDLYFPASFIDYFYLVAYFIMSISLINLKIVADKLKAGK